MKKLTEADLEKGLSALKEAANQNNPHARRAELFQKAQSGDITSEENDELVKSLAGNALTEKVTAGLATDTIQKSIDVSDFLRDATDGMKQGLTALTEHIQKSQSDDYGFRVALATTLASMTDVIKEQGAMLKSMSEQVGVVANQPARGPKSQGVRAQPINKSFAGAPVAQLADKTTGEELSKSQILDAMEDMLHKGVATSTGEDIVKSISKYESLNQISPALLADVAAFVAKGA